MPVVTVTTTYLQILAPDGLRPVHNDDPAVRVVEAEEPLPDFYRFLYGTVGRAYHWTDRLGWSDERLHSYLASPAVSVHVLYVRGTPAGYVELNREAPEPGTEVAYFGLFQPFQGRGLGKYLLAEGVRRAFAAGPSRVWVHTCTLDGPHALANYQARGFVAYRTETHEQELGPPRP
ncbi:MAG TPA: GNAT family N-acetyltransferase [Chloroflexaceae bacterium]|nr:GNAT family N-acetyltransferase [Chloroflexaceae bacterium]